MVLIFAADSFNLPHCLVGLCIESWSILISVQEDSETIGVIKENFNCKLMCRILV
ncbi:hypothetical protein WN943_027204 [Citrus x changshan-huyou]